MRVPARADFNDNLLWVVILFFRKEFATLGNHFVIVCEVLWLQCKCGVAIILTRLLQKSTRCYKEIFDMHFVIRIAFAPLLTSELNIADRSSVQRAKFVAERRVNKWLTQFTFT